MHTIDVRLLVEDDDPTFVLDQVSRIVGVVGTVQLVNHGFGHCTPDKDTMQGNGQMTTVVGAQVPWDGREILA